MKQNAIIGLIFLAGMLVSAGIVDIGMSKQPVAFDVWDWVSDHQILTLFAVSEAYAAFPSKAKGIIHHAVLFVRSVGRIINNPSKKVRS